MSPDTARLRSLDRYGLLIAFDDESLDLITQVVARLFGVNRCAVAFVGTHQEFAAGTFGFTRYSIPISASFVDLNLNFESVPKWILREQLCAEAGDHPLCKELQFDLSALPILDDDGQVLGAVFTDQDPGLTIDPQAINLAHKQLRAWLQSRRMLVTAEEKVRDSEAGKARAQQELRTQSEFLKDISTEVQTPLGALLSLVGRLKSASLTAEQTKDLNTIEQSADSLRTLLDHVLEYVRLDWGAARVRNGPMRPSNVAWSAASQVEPSARAKGLDFRVDLGPGADTLRTSDNERVEAVLSHLLSNAVKYTLSGGVSLRVECVGDDADGLIRFEVRDTGIGMSPELRRAVAIRLGHSTDGPVNVDIHGLGLLIAKGWVELMGGRLHFESELGVGTRFKLEVPMGPDLAAPLKFAKTETQILTGVRVLIAEDNSVNSMIIGSMLSRNGCSVTCVADGLQVLDALKKNPYDLLLMDLNMPHMGGLEAAQTLRQLEETYSQIPVIAISASHVLDTKVLIQCGVDDFVEKPLSESAVVNLVQKWTAKQ